MADRYDLVILDCDAEGGELMPAFRLIEVPLGRVA